MAWVYVCHLETHVLIGGALGLAALGAGHFCYPAEATLPTDVS